MGCKPQEEISACLKRPLRNSCSHGWASPVRYSNSHNPYLFNVPLGDQAPAFALGPDGLGLGVLALGEALVLAALPGRAHLRVAFVHQHPVQAFGVEAAGVFIGGFAVALGDLRNIRCVDLDLPEGLIDLACQRTGTGYIRPPKGPDPNSLTHVSPPHWRVFCTSLTLDHFLCFYGTSFTPEHPGPITGLTNLGVREGPAPSFKATHLDMFVRGRLAFIFLSFFGFPLKFYLSEACFCILQSFKKKLLKLQLHVFPIRIGLYPINCLDPHLYCIHTSQHCRFLGRTRCV